MPNPAVDHDRICGDCPDNAVLSDLVLGKLPREAIEQLSKHVEACSTCQGLLDTLDDLADSVVRDIRAASSQVQIDEHLEQQIREAAKIGPAVWSVKSQRMPRGQREADDLAGQHLGQYELLERIGRGGMGVVWRAMHTRLKRHAAVKLLSNDRLCDSQAVARFAREMEAVGRLDHPNLVRAHDAGEVDGQLYLAMEYLDGADLSRVVRNHGPLAVADACEVVRQTAQGLQCAHEHGLVHRDVKPSNLMLTTEGQVKVLDLGLARLTSEPPKGNDVTGTCQVVGTGDFIAPEQAQDTRHADVRSDIYSLGCTLYFLLAGRGPFAGPEYTTFVQKVLAHTQQPAPPISQFRSELPSGLIAVLDKMLNKDPDQRFQIASEVARALEPYTASTDLKGVPAGHRQPVSDEPKEETKARHGSTWLMSLMVLMIGVLAYWHTEIILLVRGEGVLVVTGEGTTAGLVAIPATGADVQLDLDDEGTVRLKAGGYDIRVTGAEAGVVVRPERIEILRGKQTVVELRHAADTATGTARPRNPPANAPAAGQLTSRQVENSIGMRFALIPAGEFVRGSPESESGREEVEGPQRRIHLTRPFYLGVHEVTQGQYRRATGRNPSFYAVSGGGAAYVAGRNTDDYPVDSVVWEDAAAFCEALSALPAERIAERIYRLPTEAEWEYACRAGTDTPFHYGTSFSSQQANFKGKWPYGGASEGPFVGRPVPVGSYEPNAFGLYDMHGNVWEWCQDWYGPDYYATSPDVDPPGPESRQRHVFRGGGWGARADFCRSAYRSHSIEPRQYLYSLGFRVAMGRADGPCITDALRSESKAYQGRKGLQ